MRAGKRKKLYALYRLQQTVIFIDCLIATAQNNSLHMAFQFDFNVCHNMDNIHHKQKDIRNWDKDRDRDMDLELVPVRKFLRDMQRPPQSCKK